jgi:hypothetical protein
VTRQGDDLTVCQADVEQDGRSLATPLATFASCGREVNG